MTNSKQSKAMAKLLARIDRVVAEAELIEQGKAAGIDQSAMKADQLAKLILDELHPYSIRARRKGIV